MLGMDRSLGIDLGTVSVLIYQKGKGIVLQEPSVVSILRDSGKVLAVGEEAKNMLGKTPGNIIAIQPMKSGVIADYEITEKMLSYFIRKVCGDSKIFRPEVVICVPSGGTEVEKRAVLEATMQAGARKAYLIEEPIAAAIGAGLDISEPYGNMIIDVGGGTSDIAVISLGGIVVSESLRVAGNNFDEDIIKYIKEKYSLMIGEKSAETLKIEIGTAMELKEELFTDIRGRDLVSGLPKSISIGSNEILEAISNSLKTIIEGVKIVMEKIPPELASDIADKGIIITGGGGLLRNFDQLLSKVTGVPAYLAEKPISCVALGAGKVLDNIHVLKSGLISMYK
ncbi:MAG: rod shape-determining protein [Candidatus Infernicultor aquiphilus]|uniref:Cell shape-determining protein MreB n=1 Tax=Candidatus Infernicultor aquiphilus TaxID=1805029 RepID=A0A1J5GIU4_9BACT|nr:rod shape-determining protein [bacterium]OIP69514.1 MAG: rod shape-determining protein [Candidatus Atribacteria bacterium CG2_30_33_13]PIU25008.1 MAG: rod shape-determining protein [Candidatus Atribacteria bacterium CG08_land_8_20_14_0_20_33_29]PIW12433.1 MAG: rod shape-determining protein [Candidatus Atribacteria bacterium CG17_big_fil_post_rev_8_21_14_2_50_34_11]PIX34695.1 MAG: rod shape-determining protein [Candidatus Atribacteria bacterium CG_4_8_14_3_um_filter_34_18]PIY31860.1 MAG: rod